MTDEQKIELDAALLNMDSLSDELRQVRRQFLAHCATIEVDTDEIERILARTPNNVESVWEYVALHRNAIVVVRIGGSLKDFAAYVVAGDFVGVGGHDRAAQHNEAVKLSQEQAEELVPRACRDLYIRGLVWRR